VIWSSFTIVFDTEAPSDELSPPLDAAVASVASVVSVEDELLQAVTSKDIAMIITPIETSRVRIIKRFLPAGTLA